MALDQSALLEVLDALKAADVDDRIRQAARNGTYTTPRDATCPAGLEVVACLLWTIRRRGRWDASARPRSRGSRPRVG